MWLLLQRGMNNSIPRAATSKLSRAVGLNRGRLSCSPLLSRLPLINKILKVTLALHQLHFSSVFKHVTLFFELRGVGTATQHAQRGIVCAENVVYRLCCNGSVVAGSHVHFLIFGSHAISSGEKSELFGFAFVRAGRLTAYSPLPPPCSSPPFPLSGGATIFVWDLRRWQGGRRLRRQSNVFGLSD